MRFSEGVQVLVSDAASAEATERVLRQMADWVRTAERHIHRRGILESPYPASCIAPVLKAYKQLIVSGRHLTFTPTSLWCWINIREVGCTTAFPGNTGNSHKLVYV